MNLPDSIEQMTDEESQFVQEFYAANGARIQYLLRKYISDPNDLQDALQDVLIRFIKNITTLKQMNAQDAAGYLSQTVKTTCIDRRRAMLNAQNYETLAFLEMEHSVQSPAERTGRWELEYLKHSMEPRDWEVLERKYIIGYSDEEIARCLGCNPASVRMLLTRARKRARKILVRMDAEEV